MIMRLMDIFIIGAVLLMFLALNEAYPQSPPTVLTPTAPSQYIANIRTNINYQFVTDEVVQNTNFVSRGQTVGNTKGFATQVNITNCIACAGDILLSGSVDGQTYTTIPGCEAAYTVDGAILFNVPAIFFPYMRFEATETTGSATTFNVWMSVKEAL